VKLSFQKLIAILVALHQRLNGFLVVFVNPVFVDLEQVEGDTEGIGFNSIDKKLNLKLDL